MRLTSERMGYFRCAFQVVADFGGQIPRTADELMKSLPGVGRYTASMFEYIKLCYLPPLSPILSFYSTDAIASIAFGEQCGVVDGNVVRVFSRLRTVGACTGAKQTMEHFWYGLLAKLKLSG